MSGTMKGCSRDQVKSVVQGTGLTAPLCWRYPVDEALERARRDGAGMGPPFARIHLLCQLMDVVVGRYRVPYRGSRRVEIPGVSMRELVERFPPGPRSPGGN
jgi:hypothetical protein